MVSIPDVCLFPCNDTATGVDGKRKAFQREWNASRLVNASADICAEVAHYMHEVDLKLKHGPLSTPSYLLRKCGRVAIIDCGTEALTANKFFFSIDQQCNSSALDFASVSIDDDHRLLSDIFITSSVLWSAKVDVLLAPPFQHESMGLSAAKSVTGLSIAASVCKSKSVDKWKAKVRKSCRWTRPSNSIMKLSGEQIVGFLVHLQNLFQIVICSGKVKCHSGPLVVVIPAMDNVPSNVLRGFVWITSVRVKERRSPHPPFSSVLVSRALKILSWSLTATLRLCPVSLAWVCSNTRNPFIAFLCAGISCVTTDNSVAVLKHYLALPHPQLLAPLEEAEKFLSSISDAELLRFLGTYPSLLSLPVNMEVDQSTHCVVTRQLLQDSPLRH
uniref:Protein kinase domain-containing protein n=1 Tax=Echinococcus granulosus TaxID=6210 RepID=A0A068WXU5_ECHGR|nr:hypothetical protein EgrG_000045900 [Echinococcus granulosus]